MTSQSPTLRAVLFMGGPGSGKGTQSRTVGMLPGYWAFGAGAALRSLNHSSLLRQKAQPYLDKGDLVPNSIMHEVFEYFIQAAIQKGEFQPRTDIILLDAYPRDREQLESIRSPLSLELVLHLKVNDDQVLVDRVKSRNARPDDRDENVIHHRLEVYHRRTEQLLDCLPNEQIVETPADRSPLEVLEHVVRALHRVKPG